ncbi:MAG: DNA polymerase III subunit delta' [candidate division KSB1 bacterium]|nr:DNA polymerase III subunit delta' [candidate division KSB1 bacterium]
MAFDLVIGQEGPKRVLERALQRGRLAHAYLFLGPDGVGKEAMALALAQAILCHTPGAWGCGACPNCRKVATLNHVDVRFVFPAPPKLDVDREREILDSVAREPYARLRPWANPVIPIERIRALRYDSSMKSFEGRGRVVIIAEAEAMRAEAANALLKLLEEPPPATTFILTTTMVQALLPTIVSRCQLVRFSLLTPQQIQAALVERRQVPVEQARLIAGMACGSYRKAIEWLDQDLNRRRDEAIELLRVAIRADHDHVLQAEQLRQLGDKALVKEYLRVLLGVFHDALVLSTLEQDPQAAGLLVNFDRLDWLKKFVGAFEHIDFDAATGAIEEAMARIDRNLELSLVLIVLFQHLRSALRRKRNV